MISEQAMPPQGVHLTRWVSCDHLLERLLTRVRKPYLSLRKSSRKMRFQPGWRSTSWLWGHRWITSKSILGFVFMIYINSTAFKDFSSWTWHPTTSQKRVCYACHYRFWMYTWLIFAAPLFHTLIPFHFLLHFNWFMPHITLSPVLWHIFFISTSIFRYLFCPSFLVLYLAAYTTSPCSFNTFFGFPLAHEHNPLWSGRSNMPLNFCCTFPVGCL